MESKALDTKNDPLLSIALSYIAAGFQTHPCKPKEKAPKISNWSKRTLSLKEFLKAYTPGDNLGVVMGTTSKMVCVDIDPRNGGLEWYKSMESDLGNPLIEITGSGGLHLYYKIPEGLKVLSKTAFAPGVDILSDGHQVVTAPSIHASGKPYTFKDSFFTLLDVATHADFLPAWIAQALKPPKALEPSEAFKYPNPTQDPSLPDMERALAALRRFPEAIEGQGGDLQTLKAASLLRGYGLTPKTALKLMQEFYNPRCKPSWSIPDLKTKVLNAYKYADRPAGEYLAENQFIEESPPPPKKDNGKENRGNGVKGVVSVSFDNFISEVFPPRQHLIGPFVKQGLSMVYAPPGVGKTHFCLGIAFAVASGGSFLKWQAEDRAKVLYIDGELPAYVLQERLIPLAATLNGEKIHFDIITPDTQPDGVMPDLSTQEGQDAIAPHVAAADFIVIDNISTLVRSGKENEAESWIPVQLWALSLRKASKSVVFVHHSGKGEGASPRGTSKREDVLDLIIGLSHPKDYEADQGCVFEVKFRKARNFRTPSEIKSFQAKYTKTEFGPPSWNWEGLEERNADKIERLLSDGTSQKEIAETLGVSRSYVARVARSIQPEKSDKGAKGFKRFSDDENF